MTAVKKTVKNGCRGIPGPGRPKGSKSKFAILNSEYFKQRSEEEGQVIIDKFIEAAKRGIPWAIQEFLNRNLGRVKESIEHSGEVSVALSISDFKSSMAKLKK